LWLVSSPPRGTRTPELLVMPCVLAVGTAVAGGPPRRSQRALLAHWAPPLGTGVESVVGPGMHDAGFGEPSDDEAVHAFPVQAAALAATP
jgi:hypothetical protein